MIDYTAQHGSDDGNILHLVLKVAYSSYLVFFFSAVHLVLMQFPSQIANLIVTASVHHWYPMTVLESSHTMAVKVNILFLLQGLCLLLETLTLS